MKNKIIAANWKSNKTVSESIDWFMTFGNAVQNGPPLPSEMRIILCLPYTHLYIMHDLCSKAGLPVAIGAQDVSPFPDGAYTGQISARMINDLAEWVIVGHSERRKYFHETDEDLAKKVNSVHKENLKVIYCVSDDKMPVPSVDIVAYEPLWAIGTGKTDTPENAGNVLSKLKNYSGVATALYGGSVTPENVAGFLSQPAIDGVLIGGASLDAEKFIRLIRMAAA